MSITRARTSSVAQGPSTRKNVLGGNDVILGGSYDAIGTAVVGSGGQTTISFTSIPGTYKHLQLRGIALSASAGAVVYANYNSDTGSNYARHRLVGAGGNPPNAFGGGSQTTFSIFGDLTGTAATPSPAGIVMDVLDYANTNKYKTTRILCGADRNGSGEVELISSVWMNTNAITRIDLTIGGSVSSFAQYTQFDLYGVK
jgi:hypothetical protein